MMLNYSSYSLVITRHLLTALAPDSAYLSALNRTIILKENIPPTPRDRNGANNKGRAFATQKKCDPCFLHGQY